MKRTFDTRCFQLSELNQEAKINESGLICRSEQEYDRKIDEVVKNYLAHSDPHRAILLSGPSASGKTISSYRLQHRLQHYDMAPVVVSLDDFYLPIEQLPVLNGRIQRDVVEALDIPLINRTLEQLMKTGAACLPRFDFARSRRIPEARYIRMEKNSVLIVEGIHALNPRLYEHAPSADLLKIYIDIRCDYVLEGQILLNSRELRLIRRCVRDHHYRGATLSVTFDMWKDVCEAEDRYIRPFLSTADVLINTVHEYEPMVYRDEFLSLASKLLPQQENYEMAHRLSEKLRAFHSIPMQKVPKQSMLQEFIVSY